MSDRFLVSLPTSARLSRSRRVEMLEYKKIVKITDISGIKHEVSCIACAIQSGTVALPVERIAETEYFVAEQDFEYPIEGFLIIASKRHIKSVMELTNEEQKDFIAFLSKCRMAIKEKLGIDEITIVQEETSSSSHFHVWLFPWLSWMDAKRKKISSIMEIMDMAKTQNSTQGMDRIKQAAAILQEYFKK